MAQNLQLYRNSIDSNLFETKSVAITNLKEKLSAAHDGEIVLARYKDGEEIETLFGIAVSGTNKSGYTIFENAKEVSLGSDSSSKNFLKNEGENGEQILAVRGITTDATKTSKKITVAGLSGTLGAGYKNGDVIEAGTSIDVILEKLLSKEIYPTTSIRQTKGNISSSVGAPTISLSNSSSLQEVGSSITLSGVTCGSLSVSTTASTVTGLTNGYSATNDDQADSTATTISKTVTSAITDSAYTLNVTFTGFGNKSSVSATANSQSACKITAQTLTVGLGTNKVEANQTGPVVSGHADAITSGYVVSNLGNTDSAYTYSGVTALNKELPSPSSSASTTIIGVYPCYSNVVSSTVANTTTVNKTLTLSSGTTFEITFGPETNAFHAFAYPATHTLSKVQNYNSMSKTYGDYTGGYETSDATYKVQGTDTSYKVWKRLGSQYSESTKFKFILNKNLNTK